MTLIRQEMVASASIPDLYSAIITGRGKVLAIWRPLHSAYMTSLITASKVEFPGSDIPDLDRSIITGGGYASSIRRPGNSADQRTMTTIRIYMPTSSGIPDLNRLIITTRSQ
jgi:hypothetical protein